MTINADFLTKLTRKLALKLLSLMTYCSFEALWKAVMLFLVTILSSLIKLTFTLWEKYILLLKNSYFSIYPLVWLPQGDERGFYEIWQEV